MKQVYKIDSEGYYIEPVIVEGSVPRACVENAPPNGLFRPRFVENEWAEGMSQEEIDDLKNAPVPLSETDQLNKKYTDLVFELMMKGVL